MTPSADDQIDHIVRMMLEGEWQGGRSHKALAIEWGCHPRTVCDRAIAASAVCRRIGGPVDELVRAKLAELEHIKDVALGLDKPDVKAAHLAVKTYLEVLGAFNHVKKTQELAPDDVDRMTPAEKLEAHRKVVAELEQQIAGKDKVH